MARIVYKKLGLKVLEGVSSTSAKYFVGYISFTNEEEYTLDKAVLLY